MLKNVKFPDYFYCSCYHGVKNKPCKHNVFIMCKKGLLEFPEAVTAEPLQAAPKRGRPKKVRAGGALEMNEEEYFI